MENRLSSNYLYHYKKGINVVKLILEYGFRHTLWSEKVLFKDSEQQNFMVCFCDILAEQADFHKSCYGNIAIVLTKEWGIKNDISPVRYVHKNSVGQKSDYIRLKNIHREVYNNNVCQYACDYICMGVAKDNNQMTGMSISESANLNNNWDNYLQGLSDETEDIIAELQKSGKEHIFYKYLNSIGNRFAELYNELENRDSFVRVYQDDFTSFDEKLFKDKILYDEREWRSIKYIDGEYLKNNPNSYSDAIQNKYLPKDFNLTFASDDLVAILVENQEQIDEIQNFIKKDTTMLDANKDLNKIQLYNNFKEK
ncbi:hypothetical protein FACS1894162_5360 [Bacteroidia bacterium]|nr:hypothetical protein FACS1894162_5360 [Bacteroidia bacterium]